MVTEAALPRAVTLRSGVDRRDAAVLSLGTLASGTLAYAFNVLAARSLGPEAFGPVAILWATLFLVAVLLFRPLEQTMSRAVAERVAHGEDARGTVRAVARLSATVAGLAAALCVLAWEPLTSVLFSGRDELTLALALGLVGYAGSYAVRGIASGLRWFTGYGVVLLADGAVRVVVALPLVFLASPAVAAAAICTAAIAGALAPLAVGGRRALSRLEGEPAAPLRVRRAGRFAGPAAVVAACEQVLISGGPILLLLTGGRDAATEAGVLFAATMLVRAPVFLFQGLAASLLPQLTTFHARDDQAAVRRATLLTASALSGFAVVLALGALVAGPDAMSILYGADFEAGSTVLALLALGVGAFLIAATFSQAALARERVGAAAAAWAASATVFVALNLGLAAAPFTRVAIAFAAASALAAAALLVVVRRGQR